MQETSGKARTKTKNKYNAKTYDSLRIVVPKGRKEIIRSCAEAAGESLNGYVTKAVDDRMDRDRSDNNA